VDDRTKTYLTIGALGLGVLAFMKRKDLSDLASAALTEINDAIFRQVIPARAEPYADVIKQVASESGIDPFIIVALGDQETRWGTVKGYEGTTGPSIIGADGTGHGLMQIDSGTWGDWLATNDWTDPLTNVRKGVSIFSTDLDYFASKGLEGDERTRAALAAYNHGPSNVWANIQAGRDVDYRTTGGNYSQRVWDAFQNFSTSFASILGGGPDVA
jgi:membrane-bound lytic murein transglycosylase MltF